MATAPAQKSAPKKGADKKADGKSGGSSAGGPPAGDVDPLAEKLRLQRLQEAADFDAARAAFGGEAKNLDDLCPTTEDVRSRGGKGPWSPGLTLTPDPHSSGFHGVRECAVLQVPAHV